MSAEVPNGPPLSALATLRRYAQPRPVRERCELCAAELADAHAHLIELSSRRLVCACDACAVLFDNQGAGKYRLVPRRVQLLADFRLPEEAWAALHLPIDLAFFLYSTAAGRVLAMYPSPAGATESLVTLEAWQSLVEDNPILRDMQGDVEALLVNRIGAAREYYRVGIDKCYELVGLLRSQWRGLSGGPAVWESIARFFAGLRGGVTHA
ncbi:MAG TPA: DUF5947 family protein [Gemmataceae bacterium]|nr:DUF5947 family protein [Gemmataceae bacterium]